MKPKKWIKSELFKKVANKRVKIEQKEKNLNE